MIINQTIVKRNSLKFSQLLDRSITELTTADLAQITAIGPHVLQDCTQLKIVHIPDNINLIDTLAFDGCINLQEIVIDKEQDAIEGAPWGAPDTTVIHWKDEVESI